MDIISSIILGAIQGLTEFIPVSSTGHLIVAHELLAFQAGGGLAFDAVLQLATVLAVLVYFWKDLLGLFMTFIRWIAGKPVEAKDKSLLVAVIVGTVPAVIVGVLLESYLETMFRSAGLVAIAMLFGSALMWLAERKAKKDPAVAAPALADSASPTITIRNGLKIGLYQCLALIPGVSRSGSTISGGLLCGLDRAAATRFSFLLSFPIIAGSGAKKLLDLVQEQALSTIGSELLIASLAAFIIGLAAIHFLIRYLKTHTMHAFIWYRVAFATIVLVALLIQKIG